MSWFRRMINRWRNYTSGGDYPGSHAPDRSATARHGQARGEAEAIKFRDQTGGGVS